MESKAYILIIDDEAEAAERFSRLLKRHGHRVDAVISGEEGINKVKNEKFDLILLDIKLPGIDGIQTLENIKKIDPEVEVIMVTGYGTMSSVVESMRKGASDYIEKPLDIEKVIFSIEKAFDRRKLKEIVALYEISKAIFASIEMDDLLKTIIDITIKVLRADEASVMLFNEERELYIAVSQGINPKIQGETRLAIGERIAGFVAKNTKPLILINGLENDHRFDGIEAREDIRSSIIIPLKKYGKVAGILCANRTRIVDNFSESSLYKANIFASLVSLALDNADLYKKLKSSQEQLVQSTKLASLGKLVSDMAHEVNNPLMVISGRAQLSLMEEIENENLKDNLQIMINQCKQAKDIIQRLLIFSKPSKGELKDVNINENLEFVVKLLEHQYSLADVRMVRKFSSSLPLVKIDEKQMQEVFMNIIKNSAEAMLRGGTITITTSKKSKFLIIEFNDTGEGISEEALKDIFDPFFTTKKDGTGLGLSICYGIVKSHGGELKYSSKPGEGTTAMILLPIDSL